MMYRPFSGRPRASTWRSFDRRNGRQIEAELRGGRYPCCPCCGTCLEARPGTRFRSYLVLDASGYDLDCRDCHRFWCVIRHTQRSLRLLRMRRFVAAVRASGRAPRPRHEPALVYQGLSATAA